MVDAVEWPDLEELKQVLDVTSSDWDGEPISGEGPTRLTRLLAAAIAKVKLDVGQWDEMTDEPDDALAQAALRVAELIALRPEAAVGVIEDPTYNRLLYGHRRSFGVA